MIPRHIALAGIAVAVATILQAAPLHARSCPPGMNAIGGGNAGWSGCAPAYDPMQGVAIDADPTPQWARGPSADPMAGLIAAATTMFELEAANYQELQNRLETDPDFATAYRAFTEGTWQHFRRSETQQCAAVFARERNLVLMYENGGGQEGALLVFIGPELAKPDAPRRLRINLRQNQDAEPQRVEAYSYRVPQNEFGALAIAVPTIDALIANMLDIHLFEISIAGSQVFSLEWHGGIAARASLADCLSQPRE